MIVPTYNRAGLLRSTLRQLTRQTIPAAEFEVVVGDDGSSDETEAVVASFADELTIAYHYQEDLGFRAGAARNAAARKASAPLLVFVDSGGLPGPDFLANHLRAHGESASGLAVLGYVHGFNPVAPMAGLGELLEAHPPEEVVRRFGGDPSFMDLRHRQLAEHDFDLDRMAVPWMYFFTCNASVRTDDFWGVGGFDEDFRGWGCEDMDLGLRLWRGGARLLIEPDAWVVESPHDRDIVGNMATFRRNMGQLLAKHPDPVVEIGWADVTQGAMFDWDPDCRALAEHRERVRSLDVADEILQAMSGRPAGERVAVFGCGGRLPEGTEPSVVIDFDEELLARAVADGTHVGHHALGVRTPLPPDSVDTVIVTSRLAGLWDRWGEAILSEAGRVGGSVLVIDPAARAAVRRA